MNYRNGFLYLNVLNTVSNWGGGEGTINRLYILMVWIWSICQKIHVLKIYLLIQMVYRDCEFGKCLEREGCHFMNGLIHSWITIVDRLLTGGWGLKSGLRWVVAGHWERAFGGYILRPAPSLSPFSVYWLPCYKQTLLSFLLSAMALSLTRGHHNSASWLWQELRLHPASVQP